MHRVSDPTTSRSFRLASGPSTPARCTLVGVLVAAVSLAAFMVLGTSPTSFVLVAVAALALWATETVCHARMARHDFSHARRLARRIEVSEASQRRRLQSQPAKRPIGEPEDEPPLGERVTQHEENHPRAKAGNSFPRETVTQGVNSMWSDDERIVRHGRSDLS